MPASTHVGSHPNRWSYDGLTYRRRPTRTVYVGDVAVGSDHPIRVQSMTTPATADIVATVEQIERLVAAGCEIVRLTVPTSKDADSLPTIRSELRRRKIAVPLVADIHFTPAAALKAVEHVDKVRINPGNFADKKKFAVREYTDAQYAAELQRIERVLAPLIKRAAELGVSMRVGTNHGSLSDRIMNRYGDTPEGMVESALEFVRICEAHDYRDIILSMKASNPLVVLQAYRLLCERMAAESMDYPLHLGVTEAGDGEDGRIKSAVGIGVLLAEGIGDTVRVSLTEDPVAEIPVARALVLACQRLQETSASHALRSPVHEVRDPFGYARRPSHAVRVGPHVVGDSNIPLVEVPLLTSLADAGVLRREVDAQAGVRVPEETRADVVSIQLRSKEERAELDELRRSIELVAPRLALSAQVELPWLLEATGEELALWLSAAHRLHLRVPELGEETRAGFARILRAAAHGGSAVLVEAGSGEEAAEPAVDLAVEIAGLTPTGPTPPLLLTLAPAAGYSPLHGMRRLAAQLAAAGHGTPLVLLDRPRERAADPLLGPAAALGGLLCDGIGDSIQLAGPASEARRLAFGILQAARVRISKTEFISCPSCGRTLFDLEQTTARIKARTAHLKGLKIAVMGCVVNGPGEMADADFGYVGWGEDKIALFVGKEMVARDIPTRDADQRLVDLIKEHGRWVEPARSPGEGT